MEGFGRTNEINESDISTLPEKQHEVPNDISEKNCSELEESKKSDASNSETSERNNQKQADIKSDGLEKEKPSEQSELKDPSEHLNQVENNKEKPDISESKSTPDKVSSEGENIPYKATSRPLQDVQGDDSLGVPQHKDLENKTELQEKPVASAELADKPERADKNSETYLPSDNKEIPNVNENPLEDYNNKENNEVPQNCKTVNANDIDMSEAMGMDNPNFWNHHNNSKEYYMEAANGLPAVQDELNNGKTLDEIKQNPDLAPTVHAYYQPDTMVKVEENPDGSYSFIDDGRHRVAAAQELGNDIPVIITNADDNPIVKNSEPLSEHDDKDYHDDLSDEEIKYLENNDPGYINEKWYNYDSPDYIENGIITPNYEKASVEDKPIKMTVEPGQIFSRVGNENGYHLADSDIAYSDRQLPEYEGKKPIHYYQADKPFDMEQSTIAKQPGGSEMKNPNAQQYKPDVPISELIKDGKMHEIDAPNPQEKSQILDSENSAKNGPIDGNKDESVDKNTKVDDGTDWERTSLRPEEEAQLHKMDEDGEIDIPKENPNWKEPIQKDAHLPTEKTGAFDGEPGNSSFHPVNEDALNKMREYGLDSVEYKDGHPDFSPFTQHNTPYGKMDGQVEIPHMTDNRENPSWEFGRRPAGTGHDPNYDLGNFAQADNALSKKMGNMTPEQVEDYRKANGLTWHECPDGKTMQLIPTEIHDACRHSGGVSEQKYRQSMGDITAPSY